MMRSLALLSSLTVLALSHSAHAQAPARAEDMAAARSLGVQGIRLADQGKCSEALENLERAEALYHAPTILGRLGECQVELGRIVLGTENLNRVVREPLAPTAPPAFLAAQQRAKGVLERALPRIAYLVVKVTPKDVPTAAVTVDGSPVPTALIGAERPTDPGTHEVSVKATGYNEAKTSVTLAEGSHQEVALVLTPDPNAPAVAPATAAQATLAPAPVGPVAPAAPAPAPAATSGSNHTLAYVLLGVGGAGLITGGVTGLMAMSKKSSLDCPNEKCPPAEHDKLDSAKTLATVSTIGFGVGIAGAAVGVVLLMTGGKTEAAPSAQVGRLTARPWASSRALGLEGSF